MNIHDPATRPAPGPAAAAAIPRVSVVVTLARHRGRALESFQSWVESEGFAREQIELVIVSSGAEPELEERVQSIFSSGDRLLRLATKNEIELYDHGASHARGEWLLFTEPHCIAEPACLRTLLETVESKGLDGGSVRTLPSAEKGWLPRVEARMYLDDAADWTREGDWRKFTKRGFLLRRAAYQAVGGLEFRYGYFAETALAARLRAGGYRLGFVPEARITHYNSTDLAELTGYVRDYRRQERVYHLDHPEIIGEPASLGADAIPFRNDRLRRVIARCLRRTLRDILRWRSLRPGKQARAAWAMGWLCVAEAFKLKWGEGIARWRARFRWWAAWLRLHRPGMPEEARYQRFMELWQRLGDFAALEPVRDRAGNASPTPAIRGAGVCLPVALTAPAAFGFYEVESYCGRSFRWCQPVAGLTAEIARGAVEVILDIGQVRHVSRAEVRLFWNGKPQKLRSCDPAAGRLVFLVREKDFVEPGPQLMTLVCAPVPKRRSADARRLGLPVFAIRFERL